MTNISAALFSLGSNVDGTIATDLILKAATPRKRLIGTEASGVELGIAEDAGQLKVQHNSGTQAAPTWQDHFWFDLTSPNFAARFTHALTAARTITIPDSSITLGAGMYGVRNLVGQNDAATPNTKYGYSANEVRLRNPTTGAVRVLTSTGTLTNDIGQVQVGSVAGQRDQTAQFSSATGFVHFYYIGTGSGVATTLSSATGPETGPTLPATYIEWAYAGTIQITGAAPGVLTKMRMRGVRMEYEAFVNVLLNGAATASTTIGLTASVPALALLILGVVRYFGGTAAAGGRGAFTVTLRGGENASDSVNLTLDITGGASAPVAVPGGPFSIRNAGQSIFYYSTVTSGSAPTVTIDITGYTVPNGGE